MIPLRNTQVLLGDMADIAPSRRRKNVIKVEPREHIFMVANSCNGLFCLVGTSTSHLDPFVVCNPITGEFTHLPKCHVEFSHTIQSCGLGFGAKRNLYKAITIFNRWNRASNDAVSLTFGGIAVEIHTRGTDNWRSLTISTDDHKLKFSDSPTYVNGALHWLMEDMVIINKESNDIASFNVDVESFHFHSFPFPSSQKGKGHYLNMGVLGGCLCVYINAPFENELIYYDNVRGLKFKHLKAYGLETNFEMIPCTPSFISLKDIFMGSDFRVLNVNSRYV